MIFFGTIIMYRIILRPNKPNGAMIWVLDDLKHVQDEQAHLKWQKISVAV